MRELEVLEEKKSAPKAEVINIVDAEQFKADMEINPTDINGEFIRHSGLFAHYAILTQKARRQADNKKLIRDITEAKIDRELRDKAATDGAKVTEAQLGKAILLDKRYVTAVRDYNEAKQVAELADTILEGFRQKRDALVRLSISEVEERKGQLRVSESDSTAVSARAQAIANKSKG